MSNDMSEFMYAAMLFSLQLRAWIPPVTEAPLDQLVVEQLLEALSGPIIACEKQDGWILQTRRSGAFRSSTLRGQVRALDSFVDYAMTDTAALGVNRSRWAPLIGVSNCYFIPIRMNCLFCFSHIAKVFV